MIKLIDINQIDKGDLRRIARLSVYSEFESFENEVKAGIEKGRDQLENLKGDDNIECQGIVKGMRAVLNLLKQANELIYNNKLV